MALLRNLTVTAIVALGIACLGCRAASSANPGEAPTARQGIELARSLPPGSIHKLYQVAIGGRPQWISVRGVSSANPLLLFLHGGPGWAMMPISWTFQRSWEDFFTVVQWDQRGAGKTYADGAASTVRSIAQLQQDAEQVIQHLRHEYGGRRIILVGHSWGSILGVKLAQAHPDWLYAYVGIGQVVNMRRNEAVSYQLVTAAAQARNDGQALAALRALAPYPEIDGTIPATKTVAERKWVVRYGGMHYGWDHDDWQPIIALSPDYSAREAQRFDEAEDTSLRALWPEIAAVDFDGVTVFKCPIILFEGRHDMTTPPSIATKWFEGLQAPAKKLFWFEHSSHYVVNEEPGIALDRLVHEVLPLAR